MQSISSTYHGSSIILFPVDNLDVVSGTLSLEYIAVLLRGHFAPHLLRDLDKKRFTFFSIMRAGWRLGAQNTYDSVLLRERCIVMQLLGLERLQASHSISEDNPRPLRLILKVSILALLSTFIRGECEYGHDSVA